MEQATAVTVSAATGMTTMVVAYVGIAGNFARDVAYAWFDPRAAEE